MRFGRTIVGAVIGAAIGVGFHLALEIFGQIEAPWFAIIIGLLTGLSVRKCDTSSAGHVSYVRGALTGLIALCAIVGSAQLLGIVLAKQASHTNRKPVIVAAPSVGEEVASQNAEKVAIELEPEGAAPKPATGLGPGRAGRSDDFGVLQFSFIAIGVFIAYELGRGSGRSRVQEHQTADSKEPPEQSDESKEN